MLLRGLMAALLRVDKPQYAIGDKTTYIITGAQPGATIAWTSFRNGVPTGEFNAMYGPQIVGENGSWSEVTAGVWAANMSGDWQKIALLINPDGTMEQAQVMFRVGVPTAAQTDIDNGFFFGETDIPGLGPIPNLALIAGAGLLVLAFTGGRR